MGQELQRRSTGVPDRQPSWPAVAHTTARLWLERHYIITTRRGQRRRLVFAVCALVAMGFGAGVTLAFTGVGQPVTGHGGSAATPKTQLEQWADNRQAAVSWIRAQMGSAIEVGCDPEMCKAMADGGVPASSLYPVPPSAPDPLGGDVVVATPVIRSQFGTRLKSVYAPLVIASFGTGVEQIQVLSIPYQGSKAFEAQLPRYRAERITGGQELLTNTRIKPSDVAKGELLAGQVDPRLLTLLAALVRVSPLQLISFVDSSPGVGNSVPLRGAKVGIPSADLPTVLKFLNAQQTLFRPTVQTKVAGGQTAVVVWFGAPAPMEFPVVPESS